MFKHNRNFFHSVLLSFIFILLTFTNCEAQAETATTKTLFLNNISLGVKGYYGSFITPRAKVEYIRDSYVTLAEISIQFQTVGTKSWQVTHRYPRWGLSFITGNSGSRQYIGRLNALYGFIDVPLLTSKIYKGSFLIGTGLGWVGKPYDLQTNSKNTIIGTRMNAFINLQLNNEFTISPRFHLVAGLGFMHLSNGGTSLPNLGLNIPILSAGLRYACSKPVVEKQKKHADFIKHTTLKVYTAIGIKQTPWIGSNHYLINTGQVEIARRFATNHAYGGGAVVFYNRTLRPSVSDNTSGNLSKWQVAAYGCYEHFFGRLSIPLQAGIYLYNNGKSSGFFQQFGFRVQCSKKISTVLLLKTDIGKADFIHAGIGYTIK